jgi:hypothetical protein
MQAPLIKPAQAGLPRPPRENAKPSAAGAGELSTFSSDDLARIAAVNPRWGVTQ